MEAVSRDSFETRCNNWESLSLSGLLGEGVTGWRSEDSEDQSVCRAAHKCTTVRIKVQRTQLEIRSLTTQVSFKSDENLHIGQPWSKTLVCQVDGRVEAWFVEKLD